MRQSNNDLQSIFPDKYEFFAIILHIMDTAKMSSRPAFSSSGKYMIILKILFSLLKSFKFFYTYGIDDIEPKAEFYLRQKNALDVLCSVI